MQLVQYQESHLSQSTTEAWFAKCQFHIIHSLVVQSSDKHLSCKHKFADELNFSFSMLHYNLETVRNNSFEINPINEHKQLSPFCSEGDNSQYQFIYPVWCWCYCLYILHSFIWNDAKYVNIKMFPILQGATDVVQRVVCPYHQGRQLQSNNNITN